MFAIVIDIDNKQVIDRINKEMYRIPQASKRIAKQVAQEYARSIKSVIKAGAFEYPRGYLESTIRVRPIRRQKRVYSYGVWMARYARYVERGRRPGKMPPDTQPIRRWARMAGMSTWWLRRTIAKYGTQPHPFIRPGINKANTKINDIIRRNFKL